jgi:isopropylmalate/homocitrate/citramalate synthase
MADRTGYYLDKLFGLPEVLAELDLPDQVTINDVTLREASQVVSLSVEEKITLAHALDELGVHQIQVGVPGVSDLDKRTIEHLRMERLNAKLEAFAFIYLPDWKSQIDACIRSGVDSIDMAYPVSEDKLAAKGVSKQQMTDTCTSAIQYAKSHSDTHITFCPFPAVRTEFDQFIEISTLGIDAGADMILVADTYGTSSPAAMRHFVRRLKRSLSAPLAIHCHNDLGLALANTLAAVEGGAEQIEASVNGLGDRTGNCCLDEAIIALTAFYDFDLQIATSKLYALSKLLEQISGIRLPFGKGIVGDNAFVHRHDDDVKSALAMPGSTVPIEPGLVGNRRNFLLGGEYTGPITVKAKASQLGIDLDQEECDALLRQVRERLEGRKTPLSDEEFLNMIDDMGYGG